MMAGEWNFIVSGKVELTPTVLQISLNADPRFEFEAGQYVTLILPGAGLGGTDLRRAYSIASPPEKRPLELCVKQVEGPGTEFLRSLWKQTELRGMGPQGSLVYHPDPGTHTCFVATGTGIGPFRSILLSKKFNPSPPSRTTCLFGAIDESEILYADELGRLPGVTWIPALSSAGRGWRGFRGRVTDYLATFLPSEPTHYYLCGNGAMVSDAKAMLEKRGVDRRFIHYEAYFKG